MSETGAKDVWPQNNNFDGVTEVQIVKHFARGSDAETKSSWVVSQQKCIS
jgi:hypothetical protein